MEAKSVINIGAGQVSNENNGMKLEGFNGLQTEMSHDELDQVLADAKTPEEVKLILQELGAEVYLEGKLLEQETVKENNQENNKEYSSHEYVSPHKSGRDSIDRGGFDR